MNQQQFATCFICGVLLCFSLAGRAELPGTYDSVQPATAATKLEPAPRIRLPQPANPLVGAKVKSAEMPELPVSTPAQGQRQVISPDRLPDKQLGLGCAE